MNNVARNYEQEMERCRAADYCLERLRYGLKIKDSHLTRRYRLSIAELVLPGTYQAMTDFRDSGAALVNPELVGVWGVGMSDEGREPWVIMSTQDSSRVLIKLMDFLVPTDTTKKGTLPVYRGSTFRLLERLTLREVLETYEYKPNGVAAGLYQDTTKSAPCAVIGSAVDPRSGNAYALKLRPQASGKLDCIDLDLITAHDGFHNRHKTVERMNPIEAAHKVFGADSPLL